MWSYPSWIQSPAQRKRYKQLWKHIAGQGPLDAIAVGLLVDNLLLYLDARAFFVSVDGSWDIGKINLNSTAYGAMKSARDLVNKQLLQLKRTNKSLSAVSLPNLE